MPKAPKIYSRLTRNAAGIGSYSSLWLASDHLLMIKSTGYSEEYSRVQLRDIKAFIVGESDRHVIWSVIWGVLCLVPACILIAMFLRHSTPVISAFFLAITTGMLIWNLILGPACVTFIVTDVQMAQLKSLGRRGQTRRVIARLTPLILAAQSDLTVSPQGGPSAAPLPAQPI